MNVIPVTGFCTRDYPCAKVAVVTRTRDRPVLLSRALRSVLSQSYAEWIHVIINDCGDIEVVKSVIEPHLSEYGGRLLLLHNPSARGMEHASNVAIQSCDSEFIVIHDDDDTWDAKFLERTVQWMEAQEPDSTFQGVVSWSDRIDEAIEPDGVVRLLKQTPFDRNGHVNLYRTVQSNPFPPIAFLFKRPAYLDIGAYDESFPVIGDWEFNLRFLRQFDIGVVDEVLAFYHWRQPKSAPGRYANSVVDGKRDHAHQLNRMQNLHLRAYLQAHPEHWGVLLNQAEHVGSALARVDARLSRLTDEARRRQNGSEAPRQPNPAASPLKTRRRGGGQALSEACLRPPRKAYAAWFATALRELGKVDQLFLDVFDTALLRRIREPNDLFFWAERNPGPLGPEQMQGYHRLRIQSEEDLRVRIQSMDLAGFDEPDALDTETIYGELARRMGIRGAQSLLLVEREREAEKVLCCPNPIIQELCGRARARAVKIFFVSDTHWSESFLADLLRAKGFDFDGVFTSASCGCSKAEGGIFNHLIQSLQLRPARCLHIGDRLTADYMAPRRAGFRAMRLNRLDWTPVSPANDRANTTTLERLGESFLEGVAVCRYQREITAKKANPHAYWERLGFEIVGPLLHGFAVWLLSSVAGQGIRQLNFLSRDGRMLKIATERVAVALERSLDLRYVYSSRRFLQLALLRRIHPRQWISLVKPWPGERVCDVLDAFGLDPSKLRHSNAWRGSKLMDAELPFSRAEFLESEHYRCIQRLLTIFEEEILQQSEVEHSHLMGYLLESGFIHSPHAWVDCGWNGTAIRLLHEHVSQSSVVRHNGTTAFLFGSWPEAGRHLSSSLQVFSYWMHLGQPSHRQRVLREGVALIEFLCSAPHPMVRHVRKAGGQWRMVPQPAVDSADEVIHQAVLSGFGHYFDEYAHVFAAPEDFICGSRVMESRLERLLEHPGAEDIRAWSAVLHGGSGSPLDGCPNVLPVVPRVSRWSSRGKVQRLYRLCAWKRAFLNQLSERHLSQLNIN